MSPPSVKKTFAQGPRDPVISATNLRLTFTLVFLLLFTLGNFLLQNHQVNLAKDNVTAIAFLENQHRYVQQVVFSVSLYAQSIEIAERRGLRNNIREELSKILVLDPVPAKGDPLLSEMTSAVASRVRYLYRQGQPPLDDLVRGYIGSIKAFMMGDPIRVSPENPVLKDLQRQSLQLLAILQEAVRALQEKNQSRIVSLQRLGTLLFVMTFIGLVLIGFFIFLPASKRIASSFGALRTTNEELEKIIAERTDTLKQNAAELADSNKKLREEIEEKRRAEAELRTTNAFLDSIIENIPHMIFIKDAEELRFVLFNRAGEKLIGRARQELLGKNDYDFFTREEADFFAAKDQETLRQKELQDIPEEPIHTREKGVRFLHTKKIPILGPDGTPAYLLGISEDITEQLSAAQKMRELSLAMENALDGMARLDLNMKLLSANKSFARMSGYSQDELIGLNYTATICPEDQEKVRAALDQVSLRGKSEAEVKAVRKNGSIFHQFAVFVRVLDKNGEPEGIYCFARDVSEIKYKEALEIKADLIQMVSHELRTPIHSVREGISIVLEGLTGDLNEEQKEVLNISKRCVDRLVRLINDVLTFHKFEAGVVVFNFNKEGINKLVRETVEALRPLTKVKGLSLDLALQEDLPEAEVDRDKIVQVLTNFMQNAIKFTDHGGITVSSSLCAQGIKVSVKDTGIGVQQTDLPKLFRKFGQLESAKLIAPGGTGLGLAISKKIIDQHHGAITLDSVYKKGSVFSFTLPLTQTRPSSTPQRS